jgi:CRISPR-associated protein (TIGR03984 family)
MTAEPTWRRTYRRATDCRVSDALATFARLAVAPAVGFCYRPTDARWLRLDPNGTARGRTGSLDLTGVFEVRAFTADHELRWLNTSAGYGDAVIVSDLADDVEASAEVHVDGAWRDATSSYERLLWGTARTTNVEGWLRLSDNRIRQFDVPVDGPPLAEARVWLTAVEYLVEDEHGNISIVDERLTGLIARPTEINQEPR